MKSAVIRGKEHNTTGLTYKILPVVPVWLLLFYFRDQISKWLVYTVPGLSHELKLSGLLMFFISTFLKIFLLMILVVFLMSLVRTWIPAHAVRKKLMSMHPFTASVVAGVFGVFTPFCSCSAIPVFISFLETGVPLGITFSFLIAAPLVNELIMVMLAGLFGMKVAMIYLTAGLLIAILSGYVIGIMQLEKYLPAWLLEFRASRAPAKTALTTDDRIKEALSSLREVLSRTWIYIIAGVMAGSLIHGYVPETFLSGLVNRNAWYTLPAAVITGIPLYSCSASVAPIAFALADKGMPLGTALAFIMAVSGLSLPEFVMLKRVLSLRLVLIFILVVFTGILMMGYIFNLLF
jgi:uncharacterized protein